MPGGAGTACRHNGHRRGAAEQGFSSGRKHGAFLTARGRPSAAARGCFHRRLPGMLGGCGNGAESPGPMCFTAGQRGERAGTSTEPGLSPVLRAPAERHASGHFLRLARIAPGGAVRELLMSNPRSPRRSRRAVPHSLRPMVRRKIPAFARRASTATTRADAAPPRAASFPKARGSPQSGGRRPLGRVPPMPAALLETGARYRDCGGAEEGSPERRHRSAASRRGCWVYTDPEGGAHLQGEVPLGAWPTPPREEHDAG